MDLSRTEKQRDAWKLQRLMTVITNLLFSSVVVRAGRYSISSKTTERLVGMAQKTTVTEPLLHKNCISEKERLLVLGVWLSLHFAPEDLDPQKSKCAKL